MICCENIVKILQTELLSFINAWLLLLENAQDSGDCALLHKILDRTWNGISRTSSPSLGFVWTFIAIAFWILKKKKNNYAVQMDKFLVATMEMDTFVVKLQFLNYQILLMPVVKFHLYNVKSLRYSLSNCSKLISVNFNPFELFSPICSHSVHFNLIQFTSVHFSQFGPIQSTFVQLLKNEKH